MNKLYLGLALHSHQPVGNFEHILETAYQKSYLPFIETFEPYHFLKINLHYSGILIDWFQEKHPEFLGRLRDLCSRERIEMITGGHYEPILSIIPEADRKAQVERLTRKLTQIFERKPTGFWVAERVWEHSLTETLHDVGVDYVILDDIHFLYAGLRNEELTGYFITEEKAKVLKIIPGSQKLRYTIPFAHPTTTVDHLREIAASHPGALVVMGDDCEKFGVWPKTYEHVYQNAWLRRFFEEMEKNQDWLKVIRISDYLQTHKPRGRIYIPNASYSEMMEWVLPVKSLELRHRCLERLQNEPEAEKLLPYVRGGFWRNFLTKYSESNFLHKKMLMTSRRLQELGRVISPAATESRAKLETAYDHLLRSQCNDAYWHGIFGGLYAPHLRTAVLSSLITASGLADELEYPRSVLAGKDFHFTHMLDFDGNGSEELLIRTRNADVFIDPRDGATVREIDFKPCAASIVNSLKRQEEYYHRFLFRSSRSGSDGEAKTIHDSLPAKEENLDKVLRYDRYAKSSFRIFLFPKNRSIEDYDRQNLAETASFSQDEFDFCLDRKNGEKIYRFKAQGQVLLGGNTQALEIHKSFRVESEENDCSRISCDLKVGSDVTDSSGWTLGVENVINLLAPDAHDRYITAPSPGEKENTILELESETTPETTVPSAFRQSLNWYGIIADRPVLTFTDEWRQIEVKLCFDRPVDWWVVPIYTVSQSEEGYEKVYQGSQVLAVVPNLNWTDRFTFLRHWVEIRKISPI